MKPGDRVHYWDGYIWRRGVYVDVQGLPRAARRKDCHPVFTGTSAGGTLFIDWFENDEVKPLTATR